VLAPLRTLGPEIDTFAMVPPAGLSELHMDPPDPLPYASGHQLLGELPSRAIDDVVAVAGPGSGSPLASVELRHTGGALARSEPGHGALATLPGSFATFAVGLAADEAMAEAVTAQVELVSEALAPYEAGLYSNFTEEQTDARDFFPAATYERLRVVKAEYDPDDLFRANHPIPAS
jgi:hypothetical protein